MIGGTSNLNPEDVESMTVLRTLLQLPSMVQEPRNGVVMIHSKRGKKERIIFR
jgi:hypothetical protein